MKFHIFTVRGYCGLPTCCLSVPHQWQGTAQRRHFKGPSILLCLQQLWLSYSTQPQDLRISGTLLESWQPWSPLICPSVSSRAVISTVPWLIFCPKFEVLIHQLRHDYQWNNSVIVMVTSSWDTDIAVLSKCKFTITCISFVHLPSYWTKLKKIAAQEEAPNPVDS